MINGFGLLFIVERVGILSFGGGVFSVGIDLFVWVCVLGWVGAACFCVRGGWFIRLGVWEGLYSGLFGEKFGL